MHLALSTRKRLTTSFPGRRIFPNAISITIPGVDTRASKLHGMQRPSHWGVTINHQSLITFDPDHLFFLID
jgi:hypothetical protein